MAADILLGVVDGIEEGCVYGLMAAGLTLIVGVMDIVNIAQGVLVVLGAYLTYALSQQLHFDLFVSLLVTVPALFALGVGIQVVILRRLPEREKVLMSVVATFAIALLVQGILSAIFGTNYVQLHASYITESTSFFGLYIPFIYTYGALLAIAVMGALAAFLYRTRVGMTVRAVMQNRRGAELVGIGVERVAALTMGIGVGVTAIGGLFFGATNTFTPNSGNDLISRLLTIIVLGGMGSIWGALLAAIAMLTIEDLVSVMWSPTWATGVFYIALILVLLARPSGVLGRGLATLE